MGQLWAQSNTRRNKIKERKKKETLSQRKQRENKGLPLGLSPTRYQPKSKGVSETLNIKRKKKKGRESCCIVRRSPPLTWPSRTPPGTSSQSRRFHHLPRHRVSSPTKTDSAVVHVAVTHGVQLAPYPSSSRRLHHSTCGSRRLMVVAFCFSRHDLHRRCGHVVHVAVRLQRHQQQRRAPSSLLLASLFSVHAFATKAVVTSSSAVETATTDSDSDTSSLFCYFSCLSVVCCFILVW